MVAHGACKESFLQPQIYLAWGVMTNFGYSVALDGDTLAVGAYGDNDSRGSVYTFTRNSITWHLQEKISSGGFSDTTLNSDDQFGYSVALDGGTLVVGAYRPHHYGAVYIFIRNGSIWRLQKEISSASIVTGFY